MWSQILSKQDWAINNKASNTIIDIIELLMKCGVDNWTASEIVKERKPILWRKACYKSGLDSHDYQHEINSWIINNIY